MNLPTAPYAAQRQSWPASGRHILATFDDETIVVRRSNVRLQWDPDHHPTGAPTERRAIQLGLRGPVLEAYGKREALEIQDATEFVREQRANRGDAAALIVPAERVYRPSDAAIAANVGLDAA